MTGKCTRCDEKSPDYAYIVYRHYLLGYQRVYIEGTDAENDISYTIENMEVENKILALVVMEDSVGSRITFTIQLEARKAQCGFFSYVSADDMEVYMEGTLDPAKFDFETQKGITLSLTDPVLPAEYKSDFTELAVSLAYLAIAGNRADDLRVRNRRYLDRGLRIRVRDRRRLIYRADRPVGLSDAAG